MKRSPRFNELPVVHDPAHVAVVASLQQLRRHEIENFFYRLSRSHATALFLREVMHQFMPRNSDAEQPRANVYHDGAYWFSRTRQSWLEQHEISRRQLETAYRQCSNFLIVDHFMLAGSRTTHYRFDFVELRALIEEDKKVQSLLQQVVVSLPKSEHRPWHRGGTFSRNTQKKGNKLPFYDPSCHTPLEEEPS